MSSWQIAGLVVALACALGLTWLATRMRDQPPLTGPALIGAGVGMGFLGALLGVVSAFWVPFGVRVGVTSGPISSGEGGGGGGASRLLAAGSGSYGTLLSVGVLTALVGCLLLGKLATALTGGRLIALVPVSCWLLIALLALAEHHESLVLPAQVTPGIAYLYGGVVGGAISLFPRGTLAVIVRRRRPAAPEA